VIKIQEKGRIEISFLIDRGVKKYRVNFITSEKIFGFIRTVGI
jgi:hypothetical protein